MLRTSHQAHDSHGKRQLKASSKLSSLVDSMSVDDKIGQLAQIDILKLLQLDSHGKVAVNETALDYYIGERGVGSVFNTFQPHSLSALDFRKIAVAIQSTAQSHHRPPVIWGLDSVHGANFVHGATLTPQPLNVACSFNATVSFESGKLASRDTRAAGVNWLFSPLLGLALEPKWSRVFETFGEDPLLVGNMARAMVNGIQQRDDNADARPSGAAACAKHFIGYSMPRDGHDRAPSWIPTRHLYQYFVLPWKNLTAFTVMESYTEYDGVPNVANRESLNYLLRQRLGFDGVVVSDSEEMRNLHQWHKNTASYQDAIITSLRHGSVDMSMIPLEFEEFAASIEHGMDEKRLDMKRLDESALRVLTLKDKIGMFDEELTLDDPNLALVGSDEKSVLDMVHQSIVLTKNKKDLLPLSTKSRRKLLVTGPTANSLIYQTGSWTGRWQGAANDSEWFTYGESVWEALAKESDAYDASFNCGTGILGGECDETLTLNGDIDLSDTPLGVDIVHKSIQRAASVASDVDVIVVCVGEESSVEKPGDIRDLSLPEGQYKLVRELRESAPSSTKIVLVYFGGRPRLLKDMVEHSDAVIMAFLPGPSAGTAIADIISGRVNPSGRLPITYPLYEDGGGAPYFRSVSDLCNKGVGALPHWDFVPCEVQWPFGHGLSYTTFAYSKLMASGGIDEDLHLSVVVENTGNVAGAEAVLFFTFDDFRSTTPEYKRLRAFEKIFLKPGESMTINQTVPLDELKFVGPNDEKHYIIDPTMTGWVGVGADTDCRVNPKSELCAPLSSKHPELEYFGACEAACDVWMHTGCASQFGFKTRSECMAECSTAVSHTSMSMDLGKDGWGWTYVNCLESVAWNVMQSGTEECWQMTSYCRNVFELGERNGSALGGFQAVFGNGFGDGEIPPVTLVALMVGLLSSIIISYFVRGRLVDTVKCKGRSSDRETSGDTVQLTETTLPSYQKH
ncbi:hypothetical protein MPSEU_000447500 [Mayamaea pseudoterrestris]|nr:hypothetical protein MPSEU_000447500 [Mayamaea pseudoterrestris]